MKRMRLILGAWSAVFLMIHYRLIAMWLAWTDTSISYFDEVILGANIMLSVLSISGTTIVVSSFFRTGTDIEGNPCFRPDNLFWRIMAKFWDIGLEIKLCKLFWLTVATYGILYAAVSIALSNISFFIGLVAVVQEWAADEAMTQSSLETIDKLMYIGVAAGILVGLVTIGDFVGGRLKELFNNAAYYLFTGVLLLLPVSVLAFAGFNFYVVARLGDAAVNSGLLLFAGMVSLYLVCLLAFRTFPALKTSLIGRIYSVGEKVLCPSLFSCQSKK